MVKRKSDLRYRRTEAAILQAFDELLKGLDSKKITVSALAREADIDRKTFYLHYNSIEDLVVYRAKIFADKIIDEFKKAWDGKAETIAIAGLEVTCANIKENFALLSKLSSSPRPVGSMEYFVMSIVEGIRESDKLHFDGSDEELANVIRFYIYGVVGVAFAQLKNKGKIALSVADLRSIASPVGFRSTI
ncbi:MAG: TetR/AcrR family transcriptional regulator [Coriobacteriales bacterium]|nr:TetR/AcrR family transcriptional regulator [Coriobacteriales bacterium]